MPRYFFGKDMPDKTGTDFPNDEAAENEAVVLTGEMLKDLDGDFWNEGNWCLEVLDESGAQVCQMEVLANSRRR
jgi:hypothetical protein